jgi:hypothetical protein
MALSIVGGGYQVGDGNTGETQMSYMATPLTATTTATLTVAQMTSAVLVANPGASAASYTTPTGTALDNLLVNARVGSTFDVAIINLGTSSGVVTLVAGTGITIVGLATIAITSQAQVRLLRTGTGTWTLYRIA